ncbi:MAG TPA: hypothetical protein VE398_17350 [Acidobacteriota bacterium]|nr:hypothetical protein [Acidobacteriota bacterium]
MAYWLFILSWICLHAAPSASGKLLPDQEQRLILSNEWAISVLPSSHPAVQRAARDVRDFIRVRFGLDLRITERSSGRRIELISAVEPGVDRLSIVAIPAEDRIVVSATSPRGVFQAALLFEEMLAEKASIPASTRRTFVLPFRDRYLLWNALLTGQNKGALGFDLERHVREAVRLGYTGMECNRFVGMNLPQQGNPRDPYPWYTYWGPSMDQFVSSPLFEGVFERQYLARNLEDLKNLAGLIESFGLKPIFVGYEPRFVPEEFLQRHPDLRGPRVDHPLRSMAKRYALCTDRPEVLSHYRFLAGRLLKEVPAIAEMHVIIHDSGAGFCWGDALYSGRNGPAYCRNIRMGDRMARFLEALQQGFRDAGREVALVVQPHGNSRGELQEFFERAPKEVALTAGNWASWSLAFRDPLGVDRFVLSRSRETGRRVLYYQQHFFGFDVAPTSEFPLPYYLAERLKRAQALGLDGLNTLGGLVSPPIKHQSVMEEVYRRFLLESDLPAEELVARTARDLGGDEGKQLLLDSWKRIQAAVEANGRQLGFAAGIEYASRRTLVRPLVPDASELLPEEREWWQEYAFGGDLRFGHAHLFRSEGGLPGDAWYVLNRERSERAAGAFQQVAEALADYVREHQREASRYPYLSSHQRQLRLLGHIYQTGANLYEGQRILDKYSRKAIEDGYKKDVETDLTHFERVVRNEMRNTDELRRFIEEGGDIGMILLPHETTWGFSSNLPELLRRKVEIMQRRLPEARAVLTRWFDSEY